PGHHGNSRAPVLKNGAASRTAFFVRFSGAPPMRFFHLVDRDSQAHGKWPPILLLRGLRLRQSVGVSVREDSPGDPRKLVRQRHGSDVARDWDFEWGEPLIEGMSIAPWTAKDGLGAKNEEATQTAVASLADPGQSRLPTRRMLPWNETEPGGEVP